ncbi:MAG: 2-5 ligase [Acidimicrobiales bacterium]|nr:2-5 ligase [Acidimicrobiales bacterium]
MRLFVAVWPPAEAVDAVAKVDRPAVDGLRWTTPDQWHVTMRFLGNVDDPAPVVASLRDRVRPLAPVGVRMGPSLGRFGRRVLHVPVSGLESAAAAVAAAVTDAAVVSPDVGRDDDRPFHGHLTLARARDRGGVDLRPFDGVVCGPVDWTVDEVTLVRSHLGRGGARYEIVDAVRMAGSEA